MRQIQQRVRAVLVEKSAATRAGHGHHVRVRGRRGGSLLDRSAVNAVRFAIAQNRCAVGIAADQSDAGKRKAATELGEILGYVVRAAAVAIGLAGDVGKRVLRRPHVNHFDVVNNPVAAGKQAAAIFEFNGLHGHDSNCCTSVHRVEDFWQKSWLAGLEPAASSWGSPSDRNAKKNFQPVDTKGVLEKMAAIPIQQWNYKWEKDTDVPNIGPMAQDFKAAFYPSRDDKSITTLEFDGVELAAIQGLNQKLEQKETEITELKAWLEKLEQLMNEKNGGAK